MGIMGTWQYVMVYGFGLGLGSFCRLLSSSGFLLFYLFFFFAVGLLYPPVIFGSLHSVSLKPLSLLYCISFLRSFHINFSPFFLKPWLLTRNFIMFTYI